MYFNDSTSIILSPDEATFDYFSEDGVAMGGLVEQYPTTLEKKVKLALRYKGYMADKLQAEAPSAQPEVGRKVFLADFKRTSNAVLFRLSDGVIQVLPLQEMPLSWLTQGLADEFRGSFKVGVVGFCQGSALRR